ncbi:hypothetical protein CDAR_8881 [Caerostris darwini]|uniref:Uncharacterized protein n=1 Tax=Caerostris darwini TaxID=1538125 RepID=A0AAV4R5B8_9ARAC|nr:hypothetical protein CDAR_8881 [Caerostris darwini]
MRRPLKLYDSIDCSSTLQIIFKTQPFPYFKAALLSNAEIVFNTHNLQNLFMQIREIAGDVNVGSMIGMTETMCRLAALRPIPAATGASSAGANRVAGFVPEALP